MTVYFVDSKNLSLGLIPLQAPVIRYVRSSLNPISAVLDEYFRGPSVSELQLGIIALYNGFNGYSRIEGKDGTVRVYLTGACRYSSQSYGIAQVLIANIKQFPEVLYVKIYDQNGLTRLPISSGDSAPVCLGPSSLLTPTRTPTPTPRQ